MLPAGYPPFNGNNDREAHWAVAKDKCRFDKEDWKHISPEAAGFVRGILQMQTEKRMTA